MNSIRPVRTAAVLLLCVALVLAGVAEVVAADREPNDSREEATPIALDERVAGTISGPEDAQDWYRFELTVRSRLMVTMSHDPDTQQTVIVRGEDDSTWLFSGLVARGEPTVEITDPLGRPYDPGTYYVTISGWDSSDYELVVRATPLADNNREPNDSPEEATSLALGERVAGTVSWPDDTEDWYRIEVTEPSRLTVTVDHDPDTRQVVTVYAEDGSTRLFRGLIASGEPTVAVSTPQGRVHDPGTYYVTVSGSAPGDYELAVTATRADAPAETGTPTVDEAAAELGVGDQSAPIAPRPGSAPTGEWGAVTDVPMAQMVDRERVQSLFIRTDGAATVTAVELSGPDADAFEVSGLAVGQRLGANEAVQHSVRFTPTSPGELEATLTVTVDGRGSVEYRLAVLALSPDAYEDNDGFDAAAMVDPGVHEATVGGPRDVDIYGYDLGAGDDATVTLTNEHTVPLNYFLAGPDGTQTEITALEPGATVEHAFAASRAGTYYVLVGTGMTDGDDINRFEVEIPYTLTLDVVATETPTPTPDADPTGSTGSDAADSGGSSTSTTFPGFGPVAVVVALAVVLLGLGGRRLRR